MALPVSISSPRARQRLARTVAHCAIGATGILFAFPFYWLFISAFKSREEIFTLPPQWFPWPWHITNFVEVLTETNLVQAFSNSVIVAVGHCFLAVLLCSLAGYAFAKFPDAPGRKLLFGFVLATMMIPGTITLIPVFVVLCKLHAINTYWAMIVPGAANAFGIFWIRQGAMQSVHSDLLDAARIDGCSEFGIYWRIVVPILKPAMAALAVLALMNNWNNLMWAFIVMRTENMFTLPLMIYLLQGEMRIPYGQIMAASLIATMPLVVAFLLFQRQFIAGITAGAIKQ